MRTQSSRYLLLLWELIGFCRAALWLQLLTLTVCLSVSYRPKRWSNQIIPHANALKRRHLTFPDGIFTSWTRRFDSQKTPFTATEGQFLYLLWSIREAFIYFWQRFKRVIWSQPYSKRPIHPHMREGTVCGGRCDKDHLAKSQSIAWMSSDNVP